MAAPEGNTFAEGNGRPSKYNESFDELAYKFCLLGATDSQLADFFEVTEQTINNWKNEYPSFFESIRNGKVLADMNVSHSLYKTTQDRIVVEQVPFKTKNVYYNDEGKRVESEVVEIIEVEKVIPADFRSQQFWLKNRKSDSWRDQQIIDHQSKGESISPMQFEVINGNKDS